MARPTFPLRFSEPSLRELVRVVAEREGISQNELLEQAAEHEVIARGALLADELEASASTFRALTAPAAAALIEASITSFVEGEALPEPMRPRKVERHQSGKASRVGTSIGAVAAFDRD